MVLTLMRISAVTVALQLPEGGRVIEEFPSKTSLWEVLVQFEQKGELNLTRRTKGGKYLQPSVVFMNSSVLALHFFVAPILAPI